MTTKDAILGLAAKISGSTVPNVTTDAQALSELAKAMCGSAPTEPIATVDDAIAYITANYSGGGGGGVDLGPLGLVLLESSAAPTVNEEAVLDTLIDTGKIDEVEVFGGDPATMVSRAAAGLTLTTFASGAEFVDTMDAYVCTLADYKYASVEPWDGTITRIETELEGQPAYAWEFVMPELQEGEYLVLWAYLAS